MFRTSAIQFHPDQGGEKITAHAHLDKGCNWLSIFDSEPKELCTFFIYSASYCRRLADAINQVVLEEELPVETAAAEDDEIPF